MYPYSAAFLSLQSIRDSELHIPDGLRSFITIVAIVSNISLYDFRFVTIFVIPRKWFSFVFILYFANFVLKLYRSQKIISFLVQGEAVNVSPFFTLVFSILFPKKFINLCLSSIHQHSRITPVIACPSLPSRYPLERLRIPLRQSLSGSDSLISDALALAELFPSG